MRKIFTLIATVLLTTTAWTQMPQKISYQTVIRDGGVLVTNQSVGMQISILRGVDRTPVYTETQTTDTNVNGVASIEIGGGPGFDTINWANGSYYIESQTDPTGPFSSYTITGESKLLSVPFALYAKRVNGHFPGEHYGGGIIVAVSKNDGVEHGLIASLTNLGPDPGSSWCDLIYMDSLIGTSAQSFTDGLANTIAIIAQSPEYASAAKLCYDYRGGGFSDWYLPAIQELKEFYEALYDVNNNLPLDDGFRFDNYWSSTENKDDIPGEKTTYFIGFHVGMLNPGGHKSHLLRVRAVRKF